MLLAVGAVLASARSYVAIAEWARCAEQAVVVVGPTPPAATFGRVLAAVDPVALRRALARLPGPQCPGLRDRHAGHGRTESRSIKVVRRRRVAGCARASVETIYAITSLGHRDADARLLAVWIRSHWSIENFLHWVRDVTEGEDDSSVRTGHGPQVMAALRNTAITIIRLRGETNIAAAHHAFSYSPAELLDALTAA